MNIELHKITVRELTKGYADNNENGVRAYGGRLDVRPPYQREFVYGEKERDAVIDTLTNGFPLNVMYWAVVATFLDGSYAAFGWVTEGMDVVEQIARDARPIDNNGTIPPEEQPVIESIVVLD